VDIEGVSLGCEDLTEGHPVPVGDGHKSTRDLGLPNGNAISISVSGTAAR
jgi:hypothetical protein